MFEWKSQLQGSGQLLKTVLDAMPNCVVVLGSDLKVEYLNLAASREFGQSDEGCIGQVLGCLHAGETSQGCGGSDNCSQCAVRQAVLDAVEGQIAFRRHGVMQLHYGSDIRDVHLLATASTVTDSAGKMVILTLEDVSEPVRLRGLLPLCASCKSVRQDDDYMTKVESYLQDRPVLEFAHGLCPDCHKQLNPSFKND